MKLSNGNLATIDFCHPSWILAILTRVEIADIFTYIYISHISLPSQDLVIVCWLNILYGIGLSTSKMANCEVIGRKPGDHIPRTEILTRLKKFWRIWCFFKLGSFMLFCYKICDLSDSGSSLIQYLQQHLMEASIMVEVKIRNCLAFVSKWFYL